MDFLKLRKLVSLLCSMVVTLIVLTGMVNEAACQSQSDSASLPDDAGEYYAQSYLVIYAKPPADVTLDGEKVGYTPLRLRVEPGDHVLKIVPRMDENQIEQTVTVKPGEVVRISYRSGEMTVSGSTSSDAKK